MATRTELLVDQLKNIRTWKWTDLGAILAELADWSNSDKLGRETRPLL